jgi:hypothetical protein
MSMIYPSEQRQHPRQIQQWLFAVLRFAVTLERDDRLAVLAVAAEMDRGDSVTAGSGFTFFARTSTRVCDAIIAKNSREAIATLRVLLRKIEHPALRRAFEAVLEIRPLPSKDHHSLIRDRQNLWKGLAVR